MKMNRLYFFKYMEEIWKDVVGYEGYYQISNLGRVKSFARKINRINTFYITKERILTTNSSKIGYSVVCLRLNGIGKWVRVHRLVSTAFIVNSENKRAVNHKNGIKQDNRLENLEWSTHSENNKHAYDTRLKVAPRGEKSGMSKLKEYQVLDIKERLKNGETQVSIARFYNLNEQTIYSIKHNRRWQHVFN